MRHHTNAFPLIYSLFLPILVFAGKPSHSNLKAFHPPPFVSACVTAQAIIDQDINNVRARLLTGGDMWWNRESVKGKYIVPKPKFGEEGVSAIYVTGV